MTAVAQGEPGNQHTPPEPVPPECKPFVLRHGDAGHLAHLLIKSTSWIRDHPKDAQHEVAMLANADYRIPDDQESRYPEHFRTEWIVDPVLQELLRILSHSEVELFVLSRGIGEYFLLSRRRTFG